MALGADHEGPGACTHCRDSSCFGLVQCATTNPLAPLLTLLLTQDKPVHIPAAPKEKAAPKPREFNPNVHGNTTPFFVLSLHSTPLPPPSLAPAGHLPP